MMCDMVRVLSWLICHLIITIYLYHCREQLNEDLDTRENSLRERLIAPDAAQGLHAVVNEDGNVFTLVSGACLRRPRGFGRPLFESRPVSVFHEFFQTMDAKTLIVFVFAIFCLALFAAFYVTGVHMNYFGGAGDDAGDAALNDIMDGRIIKDETIKITPLKGD